MHRVAFLSERDLSTGKRYRLQYRLDGREKVLTFTDRKRAEHWLKVFNAIGPEAALKALADDLELNAGVPTVRRVVGDHIDQLTGITHGTRAEYRRMVEWDIYRRLGDLPITGLGDALPGWINHLSSPERLGPDEVPRPLSGKSIANLHALLSDACATAVKQGHLEENPCRGMRLPRSLRQDMVCLTPAEFRAIRARLDPFWRPLVNLLVGTGLRWGEATALQVADVDLADGILHVRRAWKHRRKEVGPPKSRAGERRVAFPPLVAETVEPLISGRRPTDWVFLSKRGVPIPANSFHGWAWGPAVRGALEAGEISRKPRVHDLRHTYASWRLADGVSIYVIQRQMGHESIKTTVDTYGHLLPDALAGAASDAGLRD
jgi:integrase